MADETTTLYRTIPQTARMTLDDIGSKVGVSGSTMASAVLAWNALADLPTEEKRKAVAVLLGLVARQQSR